MTQPSATEVNQVLVEGATDPQQNFPKMDVTQLVRDYFLDRDKGFGLLLKLQNESPYKVLLFASSDHPNQQLRPKLVVYYSKVQD